MDNKQTQRKPVNSNDYKRVLNERVKQMEPLQIATFAQTVNVLQTIERFTHIDTVELNDVTKQITIVSGLMINTKWYDIELRRSYKQTLRGLIQRNNALVARLQTYSNDAQNTRDALDVLITTIKRG